MFEFLRHLFLPRHTNNHRAKLIHNSSMALLVALLLILGVSARTISHSRPDVLGISYSISADQMLTEVNKIRVENNLGTLIMNLPLSIAAKNKAADMFAKNYWAHFAPDGSTSPWIFIRSTGYEYVYAGENLARGFTDSQSVVKAWMNSPTHRANILSPNFSDVGFAISQGRLSGEDTVIIVQMFGSTSEPVAGAAKIDTSIAGAKSAEIVTQPAIDIKQSARTLSLILFTVLLITFAFDFMITKRKKLPRLVGHNLDHIILIVIFIVFIIIQNGGGIL